MCNMSNLSDDIIHNTDKALEFLGQKISRTCSNISFNVNQIQFSGSLSHCNFFYKIDLFNRYESVAHSTTDFIS